MPITDRHVFYPVLSKSHLRPALNNSILSAYALRIPHPTSGRSAITATFLPHPLSAPIGRRTPKAS
ncbi:hypothetical protein QUW42_07555, partial [Desulfovibrio piger]|nr:hypothetical protein [Desulfovibrio piger]